LAQTLVSQWTSHLALFLLTLEDMAAMDAVVDVSHRYRSMFYDE
jgi:hypothetical protein